MKDLLLPLNLQFFAESEGAETTPNGQESATDNLAEPESHSSEKVKVEEEKTFTQADLNDAIAKRLERERKKFADYDEIKTKASEYESKLEEQRLAELSEKERAEELAKKFEDEKSELQAQLDALRKETEQEKIRNEFTKVASGAGITYIDDALALSDLSAVSIEDGKVVGVDDVVKALVENKPFLVGKAQPKPIGEATNNAQARPDRTAEQLLAEAADKVRKNGRTEDRVEYAKLKKQLGL